MATFEGYERRIAKINAVLAEYGFSDLDSAAQYVKDKGVDVRGIVHGVQTIAFENAVWAYTLGAAIAFKKGATNAAELRDQLRELAGKAGTLRDTTIRLSKQRFFGTGRLLRAFPDMVPDRREALASLRVGLSKATARAKAAAKQAVKTGKNVMKKEDK